MCSLQFYVNRELRARRGTLCIDLSLLYYAQNEVPYTRLLQLTGIATKAAIPRLEWLCAHGFLEIKGGVMQKRGYKRKYKTTAKGLNVLRYLDEWKGVYI